MKKESVEMGGFFTGKGISRSFLRKYNTTDNRHNTCPKVMLHSERVGVWCSLSQWVAYGRCRGL